jgi:hypothetical protein
MIKVDLRAAVAGVLLITSSIGLVKIKFAGVEVENFSRKWGARPCSPDQ